MAMAPVVSVVLPFRDAEPTLDEALASIASEDVALEIIAIDDGSRDGGPAIARRWASADARLVLAACGHGLVPALRVGVDLARGKYVARMDADDVSLPGRLAAQVAALEREPELAVVGGLVEAFPATEVGEGLARYVAWLNGVRSADEHRCALFVESPLCHPSVTMRADALRAIGGYRDVSWAEDYDLWLRFDAAGYAMAKIDRPVLRWRHSSQRLTFKDPRYSLERFVEARARYLSAKLIAMREARGANETAKRVVVWGAGPTGKRLARAMEPHGVRAAMFVDIDPMKIGRTARGVPIVDMNAIDLERDFVVVAVGSRGARGLIRAELAKRGAVEGRHYLCAS